MVLTDDFFRLPWTLAIGNSMQYPAVNWHEGLFLQPHHFQAWDRHWSERISASEQWQNPHSYGLARISINEAALQAGFFQVDSLKAKTPGGVLVEMASGQQSERRELRSALDSLAVADAQEPVGPVSRVSCVTVYVGVPRLRLGAKNVEDGQAASSRFRAEMLELPDEVDASSVQPIEFRRVNAQILLSSQDLAGFDALPIARVVRSLDGASFELDRHYIPPLLDCAAWPYLVSGILSPICDLLLRFSEQAGQAISDAGSDLRVNSSLELQRLLLLQTVNPAASMLRVMTASRGVHPQAAYLELSRLAGAVDVFHPQRFVKSTRPYDHDALGPLFHELLQRITQSLGNLAIKPYRQKFFRGTELGMQVALDAESFASCRQWYIGVDKGQLSLDALNQLLSPGQLDWKLGSAQQVEWLFTRRVPGVELIPSSEIPSALPRGMEWAYYKIEQEGAAWRDVVSTQTLAMRLKDVLIVNRDSLPDSRQLVVRYGAQNIELRFCLFGVA